MSQPAAGTSSRSAAPSRPHGECGSAQHSGISAGGLPRVAVTLEGVVLDSLDALAAAGPKWAQLAEACDRCEPFLRHDWVLSWCRHLAEGGEPFVIAVQDASGDWAGAFPLVRRTDRWHRVPRRTLAVPMGITSSNLRGGVLAPRHALESVSRSIVDTLVREADRWERLELDGMACDGADLAELRHGFRSYGLADSGLRFWIDLCWTPCRGTWDDYLRRRGQHFRQRVRASQRQFSASLGLSVRSFGKPAEMAMAIDWLLQVDRASSKSARGGVVLIEDAVERFYREMLDGASQRGEVRFDFICDGDRPVAVLLSLVRRDATLTLYNAFLPESEAYEPGRILFAARMQADWAEERMIDFNGRTVFVQRWAEEVRGLVAGTLYAPGWRGRVAAWRDGPWRTAEERRQSRVPLCLMSPLPQSDRLPDPALGLRGLALPAALQGSVEFFADGRSAVAAALSGLPFSAGDEVLFPTYHCGSEFEELVRCGLVPRWYSPDAKLGVRIEALEAALTAATRAVYVIHYLGWPQTMAPIAEFCRRHGLLLIEDCAQALYSRDVLAPVGGHGDCAIFSLHKFLPLTDGGALRWNHAATMPKARPAGGQAAQWHLRNRARRASAAPGMPATWLVLRDAATRTWRALAARAYRRLQRQLGRPAPVEVQAGRGGGAPFAAQPESIDALMRIDHEAVVERRRQNGRRLQALFDSRSGATPLFPSDADGYVPLVFGVQVYNPEPLLAELAACGIEAGLHWSSVDTRFPYAEHSQVVRLKTHLVVLPVHQDMTAHDFERIEHAVAAALPERSAQREGGGAGSAVSIPATVAEVQ